MDIICDKTKEVFQDILLKLGSNGRYLLYPTSNYKNSNVPFRAMSKYGEVSLNYSDIKRGRVVNRKSAVNKTEYYIAEVKEKHKGKYTYEKIEFKTIKHTVKIFCKTHGYVDIVAGNHLRGAGCIKCGYGVDTQQGFIDKLNKVHGDTYDYGKTVFTKKQGKITVTCRYHGDFKIIAANHINGSGCFQCKRRKGWYNKETAEKYKEEWSKVSAILYLLRISDKGENFDKIGITKNTIKIRYYSGAMPYNYEVVKEIKMNLYEACLMEDEIKMKNYRNKYAPKIKFGGRYECFKQNSINL